MITAIEKYLKVLLAALAFAPGAMTATASTTDSLLLVLDEIIANKATYERQREMASELIRRTDLIRFGKYTKGNNWDWKNGERLGADVADYYALFPIPESEMTNNPELQQNDGYK